MTGILFLIALTTLSSSPIFVKFSQAPIEFLGFWRLLTAGLLILAFLVLKRDRRLLIHPWQSWAWPVVAGFFFFLHLWTYVAAAKSTSVAHLVILFATNPIFTALGAAWFFGERLKKRLFIAYPLAFLGLWLLVKEKVSFAPESEFGDWMAILSSVLHAGYFLASKKARTGFDNLSFSVALYLTAGLFFAVTAIARHSPLQVGHQEAWLAVAGLVIFPTFLGHALMTQLLTKMDISVLSCGKLLEPGISSLMAYCFFHETMGPLTLIAFALTGASVLVLFWPRPWKRASA